MEKEGWEFDKLLNPHSNLDALLIDFILDEKEIEEMSVIRIMEIEIIEIEN